MAEAMICMVGTINNSALDLNFRVFIVFFQEYDGKSQIYTAGDAASDSAGDAAGLR